MRLFGAIRDVLIPAKCAVCGRVLLRDEWHLCLGCLADMPLTFFWMTPHNKMADAFNDLIQRSLADDAPYEPYSRATALFYYQGEYEHLTKAVKYGGNAALGIWLGQMLGRRLLAAGFSGATAPTEKPAALPPKPGGIPFGVGGMPPVTAVVPVPLHWRRRWRRGYNQAELIARGVAEAIGAPLRTDILRKVRSTGSQTKLSHEERLANVASAFRADGAALASLQSRFPVKPGMTEAVPGMTESGPGMTEREPGMTEAEPGMTEGVPGMTGNVIPSVVEESHILLVDDVFTTGATLFSARQALLAAMGDRFPVKPGMTEAGPGMTEAAPGQTAVKPGLRISVATLAYAQ